MNLSLTVTAVERYLFLLSSGYSFHSFASIEKISQVFEVLYNLDPIAYIKEDPIAAKQCPSLGWIILGS